MKKLSYLTVFAFVAFCMCGWLGLCKPLDLQAFGELERRLPSPQPHLPTLRMLGNRGDMQMYFQPWEGYLSDRVLGRSAAIKTYLKMGLTLSPAIQNSAYVEGKEGWLFLGNGHHTRDMLDYTRNAHPAGESQVQARCDQMKAFRQTARDCGVRFAVLVAPNKSTVYPEFLPDWLTIHDPHRFADRVYERLSAEGFPILFPKKTLERAKKDGQLYYKDDSHWTQAAAVPAFIDAMNLLSSQGEALRCISPSKIKVKRTSKSWAGDIVVAGNLGSDRIDRQDWICSYPEKKNLKQLSARTVKNAWGTDLKDMTIAENPAALNPLHLLVIGDSFAGYFVDCARVSFARVTSIHTSTLKRAELKEILQQIRPDCVLIENVERFFWKP